MKKGLLVKEPIMVMVEGLDKIGYVANSEKVVCALNSKEF